MAGLVPAIHVLIFVQEERRGCPAQAGACRAIKGKPDMPSSSQLQPVLDRIDADFDNSLERLFALLRIKSISADPAFAGDCKLAADHVAKDIQGLGFATEVRPTAGHPAIVAKSKSNGNG